MPSGQVRTDMQAACKCLSALKLSIMSHCRMVMAKRVLTPTGALTRNPAT